MSFVRHKTRVFRDSSNIPELIRRRSEGRIKTYNSVEDARVWCIDDCDRRQQILDHVLADIEKCPVGKYVPIDVLINTLLANKNSDCTKLKEQVGELQRALDVYSKLEITEDQKRKLSNAKDQVGKAGLDLETLSGKSAEKDLPSITAGSIPEDQARKASLNLQTLSGKSVEKDLPSITAGSIPEDQARSASLNLETLGGKSVETDLASITPDSSPEDRRNSCAAVKKLLEAVPQSTFPPKCSAIEDTKASRRGSKIQDTEASKRQIESEHTRSPKSVCSKTADADSRPCAALRREREETPYRAFGKQDENDLNDLIIKKDAEIIALKNKLAAKEAELQQAQKNVSVMKETLPQTGNAITQVAQERDNLKRELQTSKHEIQMLKNRIDEPCVQEIETLENEIKRLRGRGYLSSDEETDIIRKEIEVLKKYCTKLACIQEENQKLKRQLEEGRRISNETAVPDSNIDTLKDELKENVANLKQVAAERDKLKEKVTLLERELTQHEDLLEDVETMKRKSQMLDCVSDECKKLRTSLQGMQKLESELKSMKKKACEAEKLQNELIAIKCEMERVKVQAAKELQAIKAKCEATVKERDNYKRMSVEATGMGEELKCLANCAKEADALKCERNSLKTELKKYSCLESQYKELIEKTKHLENIKAEREMYKIKYEEMLEMECHCEMLKVQVEKFKHMEKDRDVLIQQVQDCECCIAEQEGEIKKLIAHIDHMSKGSNDQQVRMQREVNNLKNELSQKNSLIGSTEGRLSCVQEQLKNTVKEVSCEAAFLRSRISDLEKALDKAARKTNVEPTRDVRGCEEQPQQLQKQQKLTKSTDVECDEDEYYKQVLTQSKMVVKRIAQELQKHYSDWSSAKRNVDSEAEVISLRKELTECKTVNAKLLKKEEEFKILVAEIKTLKKVSAELSNYTCAKQNDLEILNAENNALRKLSSEIQTSANVKVTDLKNANKRICELESELKELSVLKEKLEKCQTELKNEIKHRQEQECAYKKCMAESKSRAEATQNVEIELLTKEKEQLLDQIAKQREEIECMVVSTDLSCEKMQIEETEKEQMQKLISQLQQQIVSMEKGADFYQINEAKCKIEAEEELKNRKRDERMEMERRISQNYEDKLGQKERDLKKLQNKYNDSMAKLQGSHEEVIRDINIEHEKQIESLCCELRACKAQIEQHKQSNQKITQGTSQEKISEANKGTMAGIDRSCLSKDTVENVNIRPNKVHKANAETSPKSKQYKCDCHLCTILEKIAHCGIESLDFEELKYLHSKTCEATSNLLRRSPTCRCTLNEGGDDPQLVKRIDVLQNDLFKKQKHTQQKVGALQIAVKMERERLQEFKSLLDTEKNRNSELMCKIGAQSRAVANIQAERDMIRKENLFNEEKHQSLLLHYGKEKAKIKKLEKDLERERMLRKRDTDSLMQLQMRIQQNEMRICTCSNNCTCEQPQPQCLCDAL